MKHVYYPGLTSHPEHHIAKKQMTGFGGVVSFEVSIPSVVTTHTPEDMIWSVVHLHFAMFCEVLKFITFIHAG